MRAFNKLYSWHSAMGWHAPSPRASTFSSPQDRFDIYVRLRIQGVELGKMKRDRENPAFDRVGQRNVYDRKIRAQRQMGIVVKITRCDNSKTIT